MQVGMIGLGKMGLNLVKNMINNGNEVVAYDLNEASVAAAVEIGAKGANLKCLYSTNYEDKWPKKLSMKAKVEVGRDNEYKLRNCSSILNFTTYTT